MSDRSLSAVVSEQIRGRILDGSLKPGARLVEDRLSAEMGVSRVPVREATMMRRLYLDGVYRTFVQKPAEQKLAA